MLKQGDYEMWKLRIEQYFQVQYYALWDVIENGNSFKLVAQTTTNDVGPSTTHIPGLVTTEEKAQKKNDEDLNLKFLRSLPSERNTHVVVWRNKSDLDTMSIDDLYNNFKIVKQEVKETTSSNLSSQNMAFVSSFSTNSTNKFILLIESQLIHEDLEQIHKDDLEEMNLKWQLALLSMRAKRLFLKTRKKITINGSDVAGLINPKNRYQESSRRTVHVEETPPKAMVAIDGVGFDWSYMAEDETRTNIALMAFSDSEESKNASKDIPNKLKESHDAPLVKNRVSKSKYYPVESPVVVKKKTGVPTNAKFEVVRPKQQEKLVRKPLKYAEMYMSQAPRGNQRNWNNLKSQQLGRKGWVIHKWCKKQTVVTTSTTEAEYVAAASCCE
nr:hypothetical protein [Tanacetum cinerariifolium]